MTKINANKQAGKWYKPKPVEELKHIDLERYVIRKYEQRPLPYDTKSICPECLMSKEEVNVITATLYEENGKVMYKKTCPEHGEWIDTYWGDAELFKKAMGRWYISVGLDNPRTEVKLGCPMDCGICPEHKTHTALALVDVTNRCNLRCPICFANAAESGMVLEPSLDELTKILENLRGNLPVPAPAVQFTGGEPTVYEKLPEIITIAHDLGFANVQIASNGIRIANSLDYAKKLKEAGLSTIYFQFDGLSPEPYIAARGVDLWEKKLKALDNCRESGLHSIVLVPTLVRGVNDHQIGGLVDFAAKNNDIVRCVNFQPVAITGRINHEEREQMRITIPDLIHKMEEQTNGKIKAEDWFPVPAMLPIGRALGILKGLPQLELACHPACGMATFIVIDEDGKGYKPITHYIDVDKFIAVMEKANNNLVKNTKISKMAAKANLLNSLRYLKGGIIKDVVSGFVGKGDYGSLGDLMRRVIMIGAMHFQDPYNFDIERVQHCEIHYGIPDGRIIPFCSMNTIHRDPIEQKLAIPIEEWRQKKKNLTNVEKGSLEGVDLTD
ncbi:MAG: tetraether lipid synthase Tes [Candidatus Ranarchaeia archaeon]